MKKNYYIFSNGRLKRESNSISFEQEKEKRYLPVEAIESIYIFGEVDFNSKVLNFLSEKNITLHLFNYYGFYSGSFYPRETFNSGKLLVKQVNHYTDPQKRIYLAKEFVNGAVANMLKNLSYYYNRDKDLNFAIEKIQEYQTKIQDASNVNELMGIEGNIKEVYYNSFDIIIKQDMPFEKRPKQPPLNMLNALISFGNSLCYTTVLSEIYKTQLNPLISYLHEPGERRFSLSLDIAEIFKPLLVDRIIFKLLNQGMIQESDFDKELNYCYLKEKGRKTFIEAFDDKLKTVIKHKKLKRNVSYRRLILLECYKLIKHLLDEEKFESFKIWW